jgi:hypothetical protein
MNMSMKYLAASLVAAALLSGCGSSSDSDSNNSEMEENASYVGQWRTGCVTSDVVPAQDTFFEFQLSFDADGWQYQQDAYLDEACTMQMSGTEETGVSVRGTITSSGSFTEEEEVTTGDGLVATTLSLTVDAFSNTLDESGEEAAAAIGSMADTLVHVSDVDQLFIDGVAFGIGVDANSLLLTLPFDRVQ